MAPITKTEENMTVLELIKRFENDILYDAHSFRAKYSRSAARKELQKRGIDLIPMIIDHIWHRRGSFDGEVKEAWIQLVHGIAEQKGATDEASR